VILYCDVIAPIGRTATEIGRVRRPAEVGQPQAIASEEYLGRLEIFVSYILSLEVSDSSSYAAKAPSDAIHAVTQKIVRDSPGVERRPGQR
jgi:hypothetical protein